MTRKSMQFGLALLVCLPLACALHPEVRVNAPPKTAGVDADRWWEKTVDQLPLPFLAIYAEASEVHQRKSTGATYIDWYKGSTDAGVCQYELQLPTPPPELALARVRERLKGFKADDLPIPDERQDHVVMAEACRGCTLEQALDVWRDAHKKLNPTRLKKDKP